MLDNSLKPRLSLKFPPPQPSIGTPPTAPLIAECPPPAPPPPAEAPVSWSNFREILATSPPPPVDPAIATPEQWGDYNAMLTKRQRKARQFGWVLRMCGAFSHSVAIDAVDQSHAFKFARTKQGEIFAAFGRGDKRADVVAKLAAEWAEARSQKAPT